MKHLVWILLFVATAADANEYWTSCNSCSFSQLQRAALQAVPARTIGRHDSYVADFDRETIQKYTVWWEYDPEFRAWESSVWRVSTEAHVQYEFAQLVGAMKTDVATFEAGKIIPGDVTGSAYDLIHSSQEQQEVANYIIQHMSIWETIGVPVFIPLTLFRKIVDLNLVISVAFSDGSTAQFMLTGLTGSLSELQYVFELLDGSARDADGNLIPGDESEAAPFSGEFSSEASAERMLNFINTWYTAPTRLTVIKCSALQVGKNFIVTCKRT